MNQVALPHQGGNPAAGLIYRWLQERVRGIAEDRLMQLANDFADDMQHNGREAAWALQATMQEYLTEVSQNTRNYIVRSIGGAQNMANELVNEVGQQVADVHNRLTYAIENQAQIRGEQRPVIDRTPREEIPNLEDLIPENTSQGPSGSGSGSNMQVPDEDMEAARAGGAPGMSSKETPISRYPSLTYGVQNTHTTILPWRTYFSFGYLAHNAPMRVQYRMNSIYDMALTGYVNLLDGGTIAEAEPHNRPVGPGGANVAGSLFPVAIAAGTNANERPQWRDYWTPLYTYYTVLGCKWKITVHATGNARGSDVEVAQHYDAYTDVQTSTGNVVPKTNYREMKAFKNVKWRIIPASTSENEVSSVQILEGEWRPGMVQHNIINDGDVKTWTKIEDQQPNLKELLTMDFFRSGLNYSTSAQTCGNVCVELDYIVQFKDLKAQARWPNSVVADQNVTQRIAQLAANDDVRLTQP